ncbi:hypothetical protein VTN49DRAFT_2555 [Thermomyces lanuginosus]|uniref:uncharacterized protein n=1 Tax=Thermomyces lanuginosus TaxID=5541 RepID=UPI0037435244
MANANSQSLLDYLMVAPPGLPTERTTRARNTTNASYDYTDINTVDEWRDFTYPEIVQRWGSLLQQVQIASEPMPTSPPQPINAESAFYARFNTYIQSRLRRALRAGFQHLAPQLPTLKLTPISVDVGEAAQVINQFRPDIALYEAGTPPGTSPNRCPGDLKVSWNGNPTGELQRSRFTPNIYRFCHKSTST